MALLIREAVPEDAPALLALYAPYVTDTAVTFENEVPPAAEFAQRIRHTQTRYPWLVAAADGGPVGYAYAGPFHARPAYDWSVENSVYVAADARQRGVGRALVTALEDALRRQGFLNCYACIAAARVPDPRLSADSIAFHTRMGYRKVAVFEDCGYKFDRWWDIVWMEKRLGELPCPPAPVTWREAAMK